MKFALLITLLIFSHSILAAEKAGVTFKDSLKYKEQTLHLNGLGVREATIFNVDVYVAGIYLLKKTNEPQKIIQSKEPKVLKMKFVRDVEAEKMNEAWKKSLSGQKQLEKLVRVTKSVKAEDQLIFTFNGKGQVNYYFNKEKLATFDGWDFSKVLLQVWFGDEPPNAGLKTGMLGL